MNVNINLNHNVTPIKLKDVRGGEPFILAESLHAYDRGLIPESLVYVYVKVGTYIVRLSNTMWVCKKDPVIGYLESWIRDDLDVILVDAEITVHGIK